jgi:hypothetical protein
MICETKRDVMKKMILALVLLGAVNYTATAQSNGKYAKNYKVCRADDGAYVVCSSEKGEELATGTRISSYAATRPVAVPATPVAVPCVNIMQPAPVPYTAERVMRYDKPQKVRVQYEDPYGNMVEEPKAPAHGQPSVQYDGPDVNARRNLNYGSGQYVPPSTGDIR